MIKNERQYRITRTQAARFESTLAQLETAQPAGTAATSPPIHPILREAEIQAVRSQLSDLKERLVEYEGLRSGPKPVHLYGSFDELSGFLIQARIASGLTQKELGERLGVKEQQIQRYEATDYASASLQRVKEVIHALGITVREEVTLAGIQEPQ